MASWRSLLLAVSLGTSISMAQSIVYVTDIEIYTSLAKCAKSAVSVNIMGMTRSACGAAVTELQSCVCNKDGIPAAVTKGIATSITYSCGSTASEDLSSAMLLYSGYCNQANIGAFPKPSTPVSLHITDLSAIQELAPCASRAVSRAVLAMTNDLCPNDPALLQSCVCTKNQNSLRVSQDINASVKYSCDPITADISVAQGVFAGYCGLGAGTTSFPTFAPPPGDMTYYITALPQYDSLVPCAQSGLSRGVMSATNELCPKDPAGLASCVCFKTGMPNWVSKVITSSVKYACSSTASQDLSSALAVWDYFCSAARAEVKPSVTESVPTTAFTNNLNGVGGQPTQTGTTNSGGGLNGGGGPSGTGGGDSENKPNIGMIVGGVVGGIAVIVLVGVAIFLLMRRRKAAQNGNSGDSEMVQDSFPPATATAVPSGGKSELDSIAVAGKPGATGGSGNGVSPVSAAHTPELKNHGPFAPPPPMPEMPAQYANSPQQPRQNELHGQDYRPELYGQQAYRPELQGQTGYSASAAVSPQSPAGANGLGGQQVHEAPGPYPNRSPQEMQGHAWMPPTQPQYYEMPGGGAASYGGR